MSETQDALRAAVKEQLTAVPTPPIDYGNKSRRTSAGLWVRPYHSDALGVNPSQIAEATAALRERGVAVEFDPEGRCIITSDKQFRAVAKACGMWDGAQGFHGGRDEEGRRMVTGREQEKRKQEFKRAVADGYYD